MQIKPSPSLDRLSSIFDCLVDDCVGIVNYVRELPREAGAPEFFHYYAKACDTGAFTSQTNFSNTGGASTEREVAIAKAIGEAVERYCSAVYVREELPLVSFNCAPFRCISPSEFALYSSDQYSTRDFSFVPFQESTPTRWTAAIEPATGDQWHVPASMVFMPYSFDQEHGEGAIVQRISTGLACHCSYEEAAVSAICEVIERDAFTITWQACLGMPQIRADSLSDRNRDLVERFKKTGHSVTLLNLTMDHGVPTILAVLRAQHSECPALVVSASAALDPDTAVRKSLEELAHTRRLAQQLRNNQPKFIPAQDYDNVVTQDDHVRLYTDPANAHLADFLFASTVRLDFEEIVDLATGDPQQDLRVLVGRVEAVNHRILLADLTTEDIEDLGLRVVRAVIPGFHPLFMRYKLRALGGRRLWEVPQTLGYKGITPLTGDNPAPHPFP